MRTWTMTQALMRLLAELFCLATSVLAMSIRAEVEDSQQTFDGIGSYGEPNLSFAQNLYAALETRPKRWPSRGDE
jgi:hypothetical protein